MAPTMTERHVPLSTAFNLRDLGGYGTADGRAVRWGRLYRADGIHRCNAGDLAVLRRLGIRTVIDLRSDHEIVERGRVAAELVPARYHNLPVMDVTWDRDEIIAPDQTAAFLTRKYLEMLDAGGDRFGAALCTLALPGALPAVFHCAAGKDRTGVLAMLVLGAIGVEDDTIAADYALSAVAVDRMLEWFRSQPEFGATGMVAAPAAFLAAIPEAMVDVLAAIRARHGSVRSFVHTLGLPEIALRDLEDALLEG